jgi:hypothetical protein
VPFLQLRFFALTQGVEAWRDTLAAYDPTVIVAPPEYSSPERLADLDQLSGEPVQLVPADDGQQVCFSERDHWGMGNEQEGTEVTERKLPLLVPLSVLSVPSCSNFEPTENTDRTEREASSLLSPALSSMLEERERDPCDLCDPWFIALILAYAYCVAMSVPAVPSETFSVVFWRTRTMFERRCSLR